MKKTIVTLSLAAALVAMPAFAQQKCSYSPLQDVVRSATSAAEVQRLADRKVNFNEPARCGGTLVQLAILRGNADVLKVLLDNGANAKVPVPARELGIQGAPDVIPVSFYAALKAPNEAVFRTIAGAGLDLTELDKNGENIAWYMEQNPVLRETSLYQEIKEAILFKSATTDNAATGVGVAKADGSVKQPEVSGAKAAAFAEGKAGVEEGKVKGVIEVKASEKPVASPDSTIKLKKSDFE